MVSDNWSCITLLTDYGLEDGFVASCHGVIARTTPAARIIDITHLIPPGDIRRGAAILAQTVPYLPPAIHVAIVDPGVGTTRRAIAVEAGEHIFLGPDNGLLSWALSAAGGARTAFDITNRDLFLTPISATFHGRDIFSPAAAHLAAGLKPGDLGPSLPLDRLVSLPEPVSRMLGDAVEGEVLCVDRFGNIQLSIGAADVGRLGAEPGGTLAVLAGRRQLSIAYRDTFAAVPPGELVAYPDSAGLVAIAVNSGDAAQRLGLPPGAQVRLTPATNV